jgi:uncharacterized coiled-coil protein SlyX
MRHQNNNIEIQQLQLALAQEREKNAELLAQIHTMNDRLAKLESLLITQTPSAAPPPHAVVEQTENAPLSPISETKPDNTQTFDGHLDVNSRFSKLEETMEIFNKNLAHVMDAINSMSHKLITSTKTSETASSAPAVEPIKSDQKSKPSSSLKKKDQDPTLDDKRITRSISGSLSTSLPKATKPLKIVA